MKCELRYKKNERGAVVVRGLVLICETPEESALIDECCGDETDEDGLIFTGTYEVRLSDGYVEHYVFLTARQIAAAGETDE